jgi:hypothetical protein
MPIYPFHARHSRVNGHVRQFAGLGLGKNSPITGDCGNQTESIRSHSRTGFAFAKCRA